MMTVWMISMVRRIDMIETAEFSAPI